MKNKILLFVCLIFIITLSLGVVSAQDSDNSTLNTNDNGVSNELSISNEDTLSDVEISEDLPNIEAGTVSGDVVVKSEHPWAPSDPDNGNKGSLTYNVPKKATDIRFAYVYVNIYSGSAQPTYGSIANITIKTDNGNLNYEENLWINSGETNGHLYTVNDHITKCYSDYMIFYNITDLAQGLNGSAITVDVHSLPMSGKSFDGRIKLVSLLLGYDDGDNDTIDYWLNAGQAWTDSNTFVSFDNVNLDTEVESISLTNIGLSSIDATYTLNGLPLIADEEMGDVYIDGPYYQYHRWDVSEFINDGLNELEFVASKDGWGSFKEIISALVIYPYSENDEKSNETTVSFRTEFSTGVEPAICIYAGTNNTVGVTCYSSNQGQYVVELLADGVVVDRNSVVLPKNVFKTVYLTDSNIRPVDKSTVAGAENPKVNYTVRILFDNKVINSTSSLIPVVYNGYLGKDLSYPGNDYELAFNGTITGDIKVDIKDAITYLERKDLNRTDVWNVALPSDSNFVKAYIYVPYNYFIPDYSKRIPEDGNMFNVTFNTVNIVPVGFYRDQSNLGSYAKYGYGLLVYDVTNLIENGANTFVLNKKDEYPAVHPSTLVYLYNTTGSSVIKDVYISNGADLLETSYNLANRPVKIDSIIEVNANLVDSAKLYVFAADAESGDSNIIFNDNVYKNVWRGDKLSTEQYTLDISKTIQSKNNISFVATDSNVLALQQIIVVTKKLQTVVSSVDGEYPNTVFAGTNNEITINIDNTRKGKFTIKLFADDILVNSTEITLNGDIYTLVLNDPTIREVNKKTVMGTDNDLVTYKVQILMDNEIINTYSVRLPILYNGYLGKGLSYPGNAYESVYDGIITGDIVIDVKEGYLEFTNLTKTDVWNVALPSNSNFVKAWIYVPYYMFDPTFNIKEDENIFLTTFNNVTVKPAAIYRDQTNMGVYGSYGFGLVVYDVSTLISKGSNSFYLNKVNGTSTVCPSTLVYLYDTVGSKTTKHVYISNDVDLLATIAFNTTGKTIQSDSTISVDVGDVTNAKLHVFATSAQKGDSNVIFNGKNYGDVWNGSENSIEKFTLDITDAIKKDNVISLVGTGDNVLSLQRIIVVAENKVITKTGTVISVNNVSMDYSAEKYLSVSLKDVLGNVLAGKNVSVLIGTDLNNLVTDANGQARLLLANLASGTYNVVATFNGDDSYVNSDAKASIIVNPKSKISTAITASDMTTQYKAGKYLTVTLKDKDNKVLSDKNITIFVNNKEYSGNTDENGEFRLLINFKPNTYNAAISFAGDETYGSSQKNVKIVVNKATSKITASKKTFKAKTKVKKYTITLKSGKTAINKAKVTLKINGKTYKATTTSKGKATFKIKLTKKGKYTAKISYSGSKYYNKATKTAKITIS